MKINKALNLVVPVERDDVTIYFHSKPISREVYEGNYRVISAAHAEIFGASTAVQIANGVRTAALALRASGKRIADETNSNNPAQSLLGEIRRLTVALVPNGSAWETLPIDSAISRGLIDDEEWSEVENALAFFTLVYWMTSLRDRESMVSALTGPIGLSITSSAPSEWIASLPRSTQATVSTVTPSSIPS